MSKHPTERIRTVQEMQATSMQQADNALRRTANLEQRAAEGERRIAELEQQNNELVRGFQQQAEAVSALSVVVQELQGNGGAGNSIAKYVSETLVPRVEILEVESSAIKGLVGSFTVLAERVLALEAKPKRRPGRPKGSRNKPKDTPAVESPEAENGQSAASIGQQPEGEPQ